jgi:hypothetical protein
MDNAKSCGPIDVFILVRYHGTMIPSIVGSESFDCRITCLGGCKGKAWHEVENFRQA